MTKQHRSSWDWALLFRPHEAACLIAGTPMPQSRNPTRDEVPADARPVLTIILMAYAIGETYKAGQPIRDDYPVEMTLTSSADTDDLFTLDSFKNARFQREELHRWLQATGRHSDYSFAPTHQAVTVALEPAPHRVNWTLTKPKRFQGYTEPLYLLLESAHSRGEPIPTAREVLQAFTRQQPSQIAKVIEGESLDYYLASGKTKTANE